MEAKFFEFLAMVGVSVVRIFERSRGVPRSIVLWKVIVLWLFATMEVVPQVEGMKEFVRSSRVENKASVSQHCSNKHGHFMDLADYGGGRRGFFTISKGDDKG